MVSNNGATSDMPLTVRLAARRRMAACWRAQKMAVREMGRGWPSEACRGRPPPPSSGVASPVGSKAHEMSAQRSRILTHTSSDRSSKVVTRMEVMF